MIHKLRVHQNKLNKKRKVGVIHNHDKANESNRELN